MEKTKMKKETKIQKFFNKVFSTKVGKLLFTVAVLLLCLAMVLTAWAIQGKNIGEILTSNLFIFWYVVIGVILIAIIFMKSMGNERFKK